MEEKTNGTKNEQRRNDTPDNKAELRSFSKKSDRVFVYAPKEADGVNEDGIL